VIARYVSLNTSLSHSRLLKVIQNGTVRKLGAVSYLHSVVIVLSCMISEINRDISRKSRFFIPLNSTPPLEGFHWNTAIPFDNEKLQCVSNNVPSLTGYSFNTHPPIFTFLAHVISRHSKIGYRYNFFNYLPFTYFILL